MLKYLPQKGPSIRLLAYVTLFSLLTILTSASISAFAEANLDVSLFPAAGSSSAKEHYFVYNTPTERVIEDTVVVYNSSEEPLTLHLYSADAVTASQGGAAFSTNLGEAATRHGTWLTLSENRVTVEPNDGYLVPFTLTIPPDAAAGEYTAFIVTQRADSIETQQSSGIGFNLVPRVAIAVWATVPGPTDPKLEIASLTTGESSRRQIVVANLHNTGNVGLKPQGRLTIQKPDTGTPVYEAPIQIKYFLAGDSLDYHINLREVLPAGEYEVYLSLTHQGGTIEQRETLFLNDVEDARPLPTESGQMIDRKPIETPEPPERPESPEPQPSELPLAWIIAAVVGGGLIFLLVVMLIIQSRQLKQARRMD